MFTVLLATTWHAGGQGFKSPWFHLIEIESDSANSRNLEDLVKARYPAEKVYFQSVKQK